MNTTNDFLDAVKAKHGAGSDYKLGKILGITSSRIGNYRTKRSFLDDEMCIKVAQLLEIEPFLVLATVHAERAKTPIERNAWLSALDTANNEKLNALFRIIPSTKQLNLLEKEENCILC